MFPQWPKWDLFWLLGGNLCSWALGLWAFKKVNWGIFHDKPNLDDVQNGSIHWLLNYNVYHYSKTPGYFVLCPRPLEFLSGRRIGKTQSRSSLIKLFLQLISLPNVSISTCLVPFFSPLFVNCWGGVWTFYLMSQGVEVVMEGGGGGEDVVLWLDFLNSTFSLLKFFL